MDCPAPLPPAPDALEAGERLVFYEVCVSLVFVTLRRPTRAYRLRRGEWGLRRGLPFALVTLLLGWWGLPWGPIYTPLVLWTNLTGGRALTEEELARQGAEEGEGPCAAR
jgi:hypothetical protein